MLIEIEEFDPSLTRVEWATELYVNENNRNRSFKLGEFHPNAPTMELVCFYYIDEYSVNTDLKDSKLTKLSFGLGALGKYDLPCSHNVYMDKNQIGCSPPVCCNRPIKIWAKIDSFPENYFLHRLNASKWITELSDVWLYPRSKRTRQDRNTFPITFTVWIRFETISQGSLNTLNHLSTMFAKQINCDVYFFFENEEKIGGHISILAARSPVLAAMFEHKMAESITRKVIIQDIQVEIFRQLLHFIYTGQTSEPLTEDTARFLYVVADKYQMDDLKKECVYFLMCCICLENVIELMAWAHIHMASEIVEETLIFAARHSHVICYQDNWEKLIRNHPDLCLIATRRMLKPTFVL